MTWLSSRLRTWPMVLSAMVLACCAVRADEEEEPNPKPPKKRITVDDDLVPGGATAPDLVRAASSAKNSVLKKYYASLSIVCDRIGIEGKSFRVGLLPIVWGQDKFPSEFGVQLIDEQNRLGEDRAVPAKDVRGVIHYENYVLQETAGMLGSMASDAPPQLERLTAAERALSAALFAHDSAVETNKRRGKNWEPMKTAIVRQLLDARIGLVRLAVAEKKWPLVTELVAKFADRYRTNEKVLQELLAARLGEALELASSDKLADLERSRDALVDFESRFPMASNELAAKVKTALAEKSKKFLEEARKAQQGDDKNAARNMLRNVESIDPENPSLRDLQKELKFGYDTMIVAVKRLPRLFSPATATTESERMAVELLFEGLLEPVPDPSAGTAFRSALVTGRPRVGPLSRDAFLQNNVTWGKTDVGAFDPIDLVETVRLLKERRTVRSADFADWIDAVEQFPNEPGRVRIKLSRGHPDPRELLTFKLLPGRYLASKNKTIDDDAGADSFARSPFGTGPYKLSSTFVAAEGAGAPKNVTFVPNTNYWRRPGRIGQPAIKEIRFVETNSIADPLTELRGDRLHVLTDVATENLPRYQAVSKLAVVTPAVNRRIHMIAINHATPSLQSVDIRRGLSLAIDRDKLLADVFRAGKKEFHKPMAGPFPVGSWQERGKDNSLPKPIFDLDLATVKLKGIDTNLRLTLLVPNDDALGKTACEKIANMASSAGRVEISVEAIAPVEYQLRLSQGRYELAYATFDYPDIWHSHALASLLDPTATGPGGRNFLGYLVKATNPSKPDDALGLALQDVRMHRDAEGELKKLSREVHDRFLEAMPFVPLWQLDRHWVMARTVKPFVDGRTDPIEPNELDGVAIFANANRWRMEPGK